jgi:hypothetical protein
VSAKPESEVAVDSPYVARFKELLVIAQRRKNAQEKPE